jgi:hypothetical protein
VRDLIETFAARDEVPANGPIVRQLALVSGLNGGYSAILRCRDGDQLLRASLIGSTYIEVVPNEQQEWLATHEIARA